MSTDDTRPNLPAAKVCEHFYASHCYRGMSVRLCMLCHEPDWDDLAGQLAASPAPAPPVPSGTATGPAEGNWRERAERAEAQLAEVRQAIAAFFTHHGNSAVFALQSARDLAEGIRQVLDRAALEAPEGAREPRP